MRILATDRQRIGNAGIDRLAREGASRDPYEMRNSIDDPRWRASPAIYKRR